MAGFSACDRLANGGGGRGVAAGDDVQSVVFARLRRFPAGEDDELDERRESLRVFPTGKRVPLVETHDPEQPGSREACGHGLGGLIRVRRAGLVEFEIIDDRPREAGGGKAQHFTAVVAAGGRAVGLVWGDPAGQEADFVEFERVPRQRRQMDVPEVNGIESAAEQGDFSRRGHDGRKLGGISVGFKHRRALLQAGNMGSLPSVTDAFQILGMEPKLVLSDDTLREAFREAGKRAHPDAGGGEGEFAALREAFAVVSSPSRRLRHWLELRGTPGEVRGSIDNSLMDLFAEVGAVTQLAESVIRKRDEAKSALVRALLEGETQVCREAVERAISQVETTIIRECAMFQDLEDSAAPDVEAAAKTARNLAFLEKWRAGLRAYFGRLV